MNREFVDCNKTIKTEVKEEPLDDKEFDETLHYAFSSDINVKAPIMSNQTDKDRITDSSIEYKDIIKTEVLEEDEAKEAIVDDKGNVIGYQTKSTEDPEEKPYKCSICKKSFTQKTTLNKHMRTHTGERPYQCSICKKLFSYKSNLKSHLMKIHNEAKEAIVDDKGNVIGYQTKSTESKPYKCSVCEKSFSRKYGVTKHMVTHSGDIGDKPFIEKSSQQKESTPEIPGEFVECNETIKSEVKEEPLDEYEFDETVHHAFSNDIEEQKIKTEIKEEVIEDDIDYTLLHYSTDLNIQEETDRISERFDTFGKEKHKTKKNNRYNCTECEAAFTDKKDLYHHMKTHHGDKHYHHAFVKPSQQQESTFVSVESNETIKTEVKERSLDEDDINTTLPVYYSKTMTYNIYGERLEMEKKETNICEFCCKSFSCPSLLVTHIRTHTGERPYQCEYCEKSFTTKNIWKNHTSTHFVAKHHCSECGKPFSDKRHLKKHMRSHTDTGEKSYRYQCSVCERRFTIKKLLDQHMRTHTGEKPYQCSICAKRFSQLCNLNRHTRIHTGEKPYQCSICKKSFNQHYHLKKHTRIHHTGVKQSDNNIIKSIDGEAKDLTKDDNVSLDKDQFEESSQQQVSTSEDKKKPEKDSLGDLSCDQCGKFFKDIGMLTVHKWIHN